MSHKLYKGGEIPLVGDIVECRDNSGVSDMLVYGKQYTVAKVTENTCVQIVYGQGGFYADRFKLIQRAINPHIITTELDQQPSITTESSMWRQKTVIRASQMLLISGIVVFWGRMHGVFEFIYNMDWGGFMSGWYLGDPQSGQRISNLLGGVTRITYEVCFFMGSGTVIMWAIHEMPDFIRKKFFEMKS